MQVSTLSAPTQFRVPLHQTPQGSPAPSRPVLAFLGGVLLPIATIAIEWSTGMCAQAFFNPIPTVWHALLASLAPLGNLLVWWRPRRWPWTEPKVLAAANACAMAVAFYYAVRFLPIFPLALIGLIFGIGVLPLAPLLSFLSALSLRRKFLRGLPLRHGFAAAFVALALVEAPSLITYAGLRMYARSSPDTRDQAVELLRCCGSERVLRKASEGLGSPFGWKPGAGPAEARVLYYRVTGQAFDQAAAEPGLTLAGSVVDGTVDPEAALGYLEWTLVFRNAQSWTQEARANIELPAGGVVSRATLWIEGEEREAAFGGRAQVREAYERVVSARRDPLLVLTDGPDRIQVRCFPVPAGGEMKIRIGITAPLRNGELPLPRMSGTNFALTGGLEHSLWIEAPGHSSRKQVREIPASISFSAATTSAWTPDPRDPARFHIVQRAEKRTNPRAERLIVVVDASGSMKAFAARISAAVSKAAEDASVHVLLSSNLGTSTKLVPAQFAGGVDNVPALLRAQKRAAERHGSAILWIHGPQGTELGDPEPLRQFWRRRPGIAPLYALQVVPGRNVVRNRLEDQAELHSVDASIESAIESLTKDGTQPSLVRERVVASARPEGHRTSAHLARLWAHGEILRLVRTGRAADRKEALERAREFQLVTPVSGAVVLETRAQYDAAGLKPVHPSSVPTVPEPETWALMGVALCVVVAAVYRRRRACRA